MYHLVKYQRINTYYVYGEGIGHGLCPSPFTHSLVPKSLACDIERAKPPFHGETFS
ncbi:hypothetical protein BH09BAC4_BH09BAC4_26870 [soil metagenome]